MARHTHSIGLVCKRSPSWVAKIREWSSLTAMMMTLSSWVEDALRQEKLRSPMSASSVLMKRTGGVLLRHMTLATVVQPMISRIVLVLVCAQMSSAKKNYSTCCAPTKLAVFSRGTCHLQLMDLRNFLNKWQALSWSMTSVHLGLPSPSRLTWMTWCILGSSTSTTLRELLLRVPILSI